MTEQEWEQLQQAHLLGLQAQQSDNVEAAAEEEYVSDTFVPPSTTPPNTLSKTNKSHPLLSFPLVFLIS